MDTDMEKCQKRTETYKPGSGATVLLGWFTHPEVDAVADPVGQSRVDGFVELEQDLESQLGGDLLGLEHTNTATISPILINVGP